MLNSAYSVTLHCEGKQYQRCHHTLATKDMPTCRQRFEWGRGKCRTGKWRTK